MHAYLVGIFTERCSVHHLKVPTALKRLHKIPVDTTPLYSRLHTAPGYCPKVPVLESGRLYFYNMMAGVAPSISQFKSWKHLNYYISLGQGAVCSQITEAIFVSESLIRFKLRFGLAQNF